MDIQKLMKQAQQMQAKMAEAQEALAKKTVTAEVAGGQVTATMNGKHELVSLEIKPEAELLGNTRQLTFEGRRAGERVAA